MKSLSYSPERKIGHYIGSACSILLGVLFIVAPILSFVDPHPTREPSLLWPAVGIPFGLIFLYIPARSIREILFRDTIIVKRYLWTETYEYKDVRHVSQNGIRFTNGTVRLRNVKEESAEELREMIQEVAEQGHLREDQLTDDMVLAKVIVRSGALWGAVILGLLVAGLLWGIPSAEPLVAYIEDLYRGEDPFMRPFLMTAAAIAGLSYYPLDRLAKRAASNL